MNLILFLRIAHIFINEFDTTNGVLYFGGNNVKHDFLLLGKGDEYDTNYYFTFDLFTLRINIHKTMQLFHVSFFHFSWKLRILPYSYVK